MAGGFGVSLAGASLVQASSFALGVTTSLFTAFPTWLEIARVWGAAQEPGPVAPWGAPWGGTSAHRRAARGAQRFVARVRRSAPPSAG
nr:hypothetical protein [Streptomyces antimycoticus]